MENSQSRRMSAAGAKCKRSVALQVEGVLGLKDFGMLSVPTGCVAGFLIEPVNMEVRVSSMEPMQYCQPAAAGGKSGLLLQRLVGDAVQEKPPHKGRSAE